MAVVHARARLHTRAVTTRYTTLDATVEIGRTSGIMSIQQFVCIDDGLLSDYRAA